MTTKTNELNDDLSDLLGGEPIADAMNILRGPRALPTDPGLMRVREMEHAENCPKCKGTGRFVSWGGRPLGDCFACKGRGKRSFKTSPDQRAAAASRREALPGRRWEAFQVGHPEEAAWILKKEASFSFAASMKKAVEDYGDLTGGQMTSVQKCVARDREYAARKAVNMQQTTPAPVGTEVDASKIVEAIHRGKEAGLKWITLRFDGITIKEAKRYPGTLYVIHSSKKNADGMGLYLGKILEGRFLPSRDCTPEDQAKVVLVASDPASAARVYGNVTNSCCVCGRELSNKQSVQEGIGPICAGRVGWVKGGLRVQAIAGDSRPDEF